MKDKIKALTEITKELNKLVEQLEKLFWRTGGMIAIIIYILNQFK